MRAQICDKCKSNDTLVAAESTCVICHRDTCANHIKLMKCEITAFLYTVAMIPVCADCVKTWATLQYSDKLRADLSAMISKRITEEIAIEAAGRGLKA